jgi:hypothetical protein
MEVIVNTRIYLTECLNKLDRRELIKIAYSWEGHSECNFDKTSHADLIALILDAMDVEDYNNI